MKTIFVMGVDGHTVVRLVHEHTVVGDLWIARRMYGSRTTGSWFNLGTPLVPFVLGHMTHYAAVDGSEEERSVIVRNRLTFQVSGRVRRAGKNGCGM